MSNAVYHQSLSPTERAFYTESNGKRLNAEWRKCGSCGGWFPARKSHGKFTKYCSLSCSTNRPRNKTTIQVTCNQCGIIFTRPEAVIRKRAKENKTKYFFCSVACKNEAQKISGKFTDMKPPHYGAIGGIQSHRKVAFKQGTIKCVNCNITEESFLQVHHIDGNYRNNEISNLVYPTYTSSFQGITKYY
jgi:hypothetical protein